MIELTEEGIQLKIAWLEDTYSEFPIIYADDSLPKCCKVDEVATRYGWGDATDDWDEYAAFRWLLEGE